MRIDRIPTNTYHTIYVSNDGCEFDTKEKCREYEQSDRAKLSAKFDSIPKTDIVTSEFGISNEDDCESYLIYLADLETITSIADYVVGMTQHVYGNRHMLTEQDVGKHLVITISYADCYADWISLYIMEEHFAVMQYKYDCAVSALHKLIEKRARFN